MPPPTSLRDRLLETCRAADTDVNTVVQALAEAILISLILLDPDDAEAAKRNLDGIVDDMRATLPKMYEDFAMAVARGATKQ